MIQNFDFHAHTYYDDGKNSPEEMICVAISLGYSVFGLSGHAYFNDECNWCMSRENTEKFISDMNSLKIKYADKIRVMLGTEYDIFSSCDLSPYDYVIGSVHYVETSGGKFPVDNSKKVLLKTVREQFSGDIYAYCEKYYSEISRFADNPKVGIIGHFDLVEKFNEGDVLFDRENPRYKKAALSALSALLSAGKKFEINTGAMYRAGRSVPYPAELLLREIARLNGEVMLSSDSHCTASIGYNFNEAAILAEKCGFTKFSSLM